MDDFWVFGYGSLMWNPGFAFEEHSPATVFGYRRSLCVRSWVHRGTRENPGLVLGLDRGGACKGMAFRVSDENRSSVIAYLRERELVTHVYLEKTLPMRLENGRRVTALTYVIDRTHEQYAGDLSESQSAEIVLSASGRSGSNPDYVMNTVAHLRHMKIHDHRMEAIVAEMERQAKA
jgi:glutathione-specific gamma-glutamylcyclotransferase